MRVRVDPGWGNEAKGRVTGVSTLFIYLSHSFSHIHCCVYDDLEQSPVPNEDYPLSAVIYCLLVGNIYNCSINHIIMNGYSAFCMDLKTRAVLNLLLYFGSKHPK